MPDSEGAKGLTAGTVLTVRVTRAAQGAKGPRLTARGGRRTGRWGWCGGARTRCGGSRRGILGRRCWWMIRGCGGGWRRRWRPAVFDEEVAEAIEALSRPVVELAGGARLSIWPTPALVAIDVDAGGMLAGRLRHEAVNRAVLPALAEQIRLRNLVGRRSWWIWPGLSARKRAALGPDFVAALAGDPLRPRFLGFTALGLAEIVRPRVHPPLHELLAGPLAAGLAALRAVHGGVRRRSAGAGGGAGASGGGRRRCRRTRPPCPILRGVSGRGVTLRSDPALAGDGLGAGEGMMAQRLQPAARSAGGALRRRIRPFCTARCQEVDLGRWLTGVYRIPGRRRNWTRTRRPRRTRLDGVA